MVAIFAVWQPSLPPANAARAARETRPAILMPRWEGVQSVRADDRRAFTAAWHRGELLPCAGSGDSIPVLRASPGVRNRFHWVQQYFVPHIAERKNEYHAALQRTLDSPSILQVHVLLANASRDYRSLLELSDPFHKLTPCALGFRWTYKSAVQYVNARLADALVILANMDVSPEAGLDMIDERELLGQNARRQRQLYAPARWESDQCKLPKGSPVCHCENTENGANGNCADAFIFSPPVAASLADSSHLNYHFGGRLGGENVFMYAMIHNASYGISNPCRSIVLRHFHCTALRPFSWSGVWMPRPYARAGFAGPLEGARPRPVDAVKLIGLD